MFGDRPGETMHPGVRPLLEQLGLGNRVDALATGLHTGIWIEWGGPARFEPFGSDENGPWHGFHLWRPDFDSAMLSLAAEAGADVRRGVSISGITQDQGEIRQINTSTGTVTARVVIDASGRSRCLGRLLDIHYVVRSPKLIARYGYVAGSCPLRDEAPKISGDRNGWTWTANIRDGLYQWTRIDFVDMGANDRLPAEFSGMTQVSRTRGADVTWRIARKLAGANWFMVGDGATTLDPTSSRGVLKSIMTGMMSGHLTDARIRGRLPPLQAASTYHDWLHDWFDKDVKQMEQFYRILDAPRQAQSF